ncbi:hypothetical protein Pmani_026031 [Petrolisthes manimaculis]|uniref:Uncharacterized protein n=1 Tax=Petrolisthes manimaculis TaxID=1843537 RepID=A0AAE1P6Y2_9EUCA|nr:hypothetical protein Pmani_026031 [Petrolisthes manimaculis]
MAVSQHHWFISVAVVLCWCVLLAGGTQTQHDEPNTEKIVQEIYYKKSGPYESALRITQEGPLLSDDQQDGIQSQNDDIPSKEIRVGRGQTQGLHGVDASAATKSPRVSS